MILFLRFLQSYRLLIYYIFFIKYDYKQLVLSFGSTMYLHTHSLKYY